MIALVIITLGIAVILSGVLAAFFAVAKTGDIDID